MSIATTISAIFALSSTQSIIAASYKPETAKATNKDAEVEVLCKEKATKAATAIGQINTPGAVLTSFVFKGVKGMNAEFVASMSFDDKTKIYTVATEFSRQNRWCTVLDVKLIAVPA